MFATMLRLAEKYLWLSKEKLKRWCSILPVILMLVNIFSPAISFMTFRLHFDKHLLECQHHRHHAEDCQASCILEEMAPEPAETVPEKRFPLFTSPLIYFFKTISSFQLIGYIILGW